jgi:hypothetical protein
MEKPKREIQSVNRIYKFNSNSPIASWLTRMLIFFKWLLLSSLSNITQVSDNLDNHTNGKYDPLEHLHHTIKLFHFPCKPKSTLGDSQNSIKTIILLDIFLWCHFNAMLIMECSVKWLIWMLKISPKKIGFWF